MTDGRQYLWYNGQKIFDGWEVRTEILCDHCQTEIDPADICLTSLRISSIHLTTEMGMDAPLRIHSNCIYDCIKQHVMERVKDKAGKWYVGDLFFFFSRLCTTILDQSW